MLSNKVLVIIPAYNEEESIVSTVSEIKSWGFDYLVVNDGSRDGTLALCKENGFKVLNLRSNLGIGGAVQAGHKYALAHGYSVDVQFDGDGQHDARYISALLREVDEGADLVIGSRFLCADLEGFKSTAMRRLGIRWLSCLIRLTTSSRITDPTSGFRACGRRAMELYAGDYPVDYPEPESIVAACRRGLEVRETPVSMNPRQGGVSSIRPLSSVYYMVKVTLAILIAGSTRKAC